MKVLIACEFSGIVRDAFIAKGHDAISCDLLPTEKPGPHIQGDVLQHLRYCPTYRQYDLMIAHPPCTYLCSSGLHWNKRIPGREEKTHEAMLFIFNLVDAPIPKIALENPIGCISTKYRKPDQIIQPWMFGEDASKGTCFWLKNLSLLKPTEHINHHFGCKCGHRFVYELGKYGCPNCNGDKGAARKIWANQTPSGQNNLRPCKNRAKIRSITYQGIADAMAEQWGSEDLTQ